MTTDANLTDRSPSAGAALYIALLLTLVGPTFNMSVLPSVLPDIARYLGGGVAAEIAAQRAQAVQFLGLAVGGLLAGNCLSRFGLRRTLLAAALVYAAAGLVGGSARSAALLVLACFIIGVAASMLSSGLTTGSAALYQGPERVRILGFQTAVSDFFAIAGGIAGALLTQAFGWRAPFSIYVGFGLIMALLLVGSRLPHIPSEERSSNGLLLVARAAARPYIASSAIFFILGTQAVLLPFHLERWGLSEPGSRALVLTCTPAFSMVASLAYGLVRGRISDRFMVLVAAIFSAAGYVVIAQWRGGIALAALGTTATGIGMGIAFPLAIRTIFERTDVTLHAYSIGLFNTVIFLSVFVSPFILGPVMRAMGAETLFLLCAACWLVGGIAIAVLTARPRDGATPGGAAASSS